MSRAARWLLGLSLLAMLCGAALVFSSSRGGANGFGTKTFLVALPAPQTTCQSAAFDVTPQGTMVVGSRNGHALPASFACWNVNVRSIRALARNAERSTIGIAFLYDVAPQGEERGIHLFVDGHAAGVPRVETVALSPGYQRAALVWHIPVQRLTDPRLAHVRLSLSGYATLALDNMAVYTAYEPAVRHTPENRLLAAGSIVLIVGLLAFALELMLRVAGRAGFFASLFVVAFSCVSQDQWDFPSWIRLADIAAFHGGSPAFYWSATPLWGFVPALVAPIARLAYTLGAEVATAAAAVAFKVFLASCVVLTIALLARKFQRHQSLIALGLLVSPLTLYTVAWGGRDALSALLAIAALLLLQKPRFVVLSCLLSAAAVSINEYFLPLLLVPPAAVLMTYGPRVRSILGACGVLILSVVAVAAQWLLLPHKYAKAVLAYRGTATQIHSYGDASWHSIAAKLGVMPALIADHEATWTVAFGLVLAACVVALALIRARTAAESLSLGRLVELLVAFTGIFFLVYPRVNPQEWYGLFALLALACALRKYSATLPLIFGLVSGLQLYAHFGFREFVSPIWFNAADMGLIGVRTPLDQALTAGCILLIGYVVFAAAAGALDTGISSRTTALALALLAVVFTGARTAIGSDILFWGGMAGFLMAVFAMLQPFDDMRGLVSGIRGPFAAIGAVILIVACAAVAGPSLALAACVWLLVCFWGIENLRGLDVVLLVIMSADAAVLGVVADHRQAALAAATVPAVLLLSYLLTTQVARLNRANA